MGPIEPTLQAWYGDRGEQVITLVLFLLQAPLSDADVAKLRDSIVPAAEEKWQTIPWRVDLIAARDEASKAKKPVFLWSMNGHPLGCT